MIYSALAFLVSFMVILSVLATMGQNMSDTFVTVSNGWLEFRTREEAQSITKITGPVGYAVEDTLPIEMTLVNEGDTPLNDFEDWSVIFELQQTSGLDFAYLDYTTNASPGSDEWTVSGIYMDASGLTPEVVDPNVFNPGEEMIVKLNPSPAVVPGNYERVVFTTPNGVTSKVIFRINAFLHVVDKTDGLVYKYFDDGTYQSTDFLDTDNDHAEGITNVTGTNFWVVDEDDDLTYKYTSVFATDSSWGLNVLNTEPKGVTTDGTNIWVVNRDIILGSVVYVYDMSGTPDSTPSFNLLGLNRHPAGITTDGTHIWVVDDDDDTVYKYTVAGASDSNFALTSENADPSGITTNGDFIWVVDNADAKIYKYQMDGTYITGTDITLHAANTDPQGITLNPK